MLRTVRIAKLHPTPFLNPSWLSMVERKLLYLSRIQYSKTFDMIGLIAIHLKSLHNKGLLKHLGIGTIYAYLNPPGTWQHNVTSWRSLASATHTAGWENSRCSANKPSVNTCCLPTLQVSYDCDMTNSISVKRVSISLIGIPRYSLRSNWYSSLIAVLDQHYYTSRPWKSDQEIYTQQYKRQRNHQPEYIDFCGQILSASIAKTIYYSSAIKHRVSR